MELGELRRSRRRKQAEQTGPLLEAAFPVLRPGDGARLLLDLSAFVIGLFR